jgi:hypothetical protein
MPFKVLRKRHDYSGFRAMWTPRGALVLVRLLRCLPPALPPPVVAAAVAATEASIYDSTCKVHGGSMRCRCRA